MNLPLEWDVEEHTDYEEYGLYDKEDYYMDKYLIGHSKIEANAKENVGLPYIRTIPATRIVLCMSKIAHLIHNGELTGGEREWIEDDGTEISVVLRAAEMPIELTAFDMAVYTAIVSLYDCEIHEFSTTAVCRTLCFRPQISIISANLQSAVKKAIDKMAGIEMEIHKTLPDGTVGEYAARLIEIETFDGLTDNGHVCSFWRCTKPPILYEYSLDVHQCWFLRMKDVQTGDALLNHIRTIVIRYCLLRRITIMRRQADLRRRNVNRVAFDTFFKEIGANGQSVPVKKKIRKAIKVCLECWRKTGLVEEYSVYKKHNRIIGIEIQVPLPVSKTNAHRKNGPFTS